MCKNRSVLKNTSQYLDFLKNIVLIIVKRQTDILNENDDHAARKLDVTDCATDAVSSFPPLLQRDTRDVIIAYVTILPPWSGNTVRKKEKKKQQRW